jgi:Protein of unknown function (DUF2934)
MAAKTKSREVYSLKSELPRDLEDRIRQRAHQLYEQRGRVDGLAVDDWVQAEAEILGVQRQQKATSAKGSK